MDLNKACAKCLNYLLLLLLISTSSLFENSKLLLGKSLLIFRVSRPPVVPSTCPVDRLRTRLWFRALQEMSGLPTAYAVEMALDGDRVRKRNTDVSRPRKWDAYKRGAKVPADRPGPRNAIEQAEARFPGSARWFRSPLWRYLKNEPFNARQFEDALRMIEPAVVSLLFEAAPREHEKVPRQRSFDHDTADRLIALGGFDALVAAILLAGLSEVIASPDLRERALHVYVELQSPLWRMPVLEGIYAELFSQIDARCKHWVYLSPNQRMDVVIFWQGVQAEVERRSADTEGESDQG